MIEKIFPILYTLDSRGKIRVFECEVHREVNYSDVRIVTKTGTLGGKLILKTEYVKKGKNIGKSNETSPFQQAIAQAESLWNDKWNEGYKSAEFLKEKAQINFPLDKVDKIDRIFDLIRMASPIVFCTNKAGDWLPMLAIKWRDVKKRQFPYYAQPKFNGVRCLARISFTKFGLMTCKLCSRGGAYYNVPHIKSQLEEMYGILTDLREGSIEILFDGELYKHGVPLQDISGAARTEDNALFASNDWLEYHIYDVVIEPLRNQRERLTDIIAISTQVYNHHLKWNAIKFVKSKMVSDEQEVDDLHNEYLEQGYEGLILRHPSFIYEFNQRSKGLIKVKNFIDEEFEIKGYGINPDKGIEESFVFTLENNNGDKQRFDARPTGSAAQKKYWYDNINNFIGKQATVRFQERSKEGLPIQAHLRSDLTEVLHIREKGE